MLFKPSGNNHRPDFMDLPEDGGWGNYSCPQLLMVLFTKSMQGPGFQSYRITASQGIHATLMHTQTRVHRYTECFVRWFSILIFVYNCCFVVGDVGAV